MRSLITGGAGLIGSHLGDACWATRWLTMSNKFGVTGREDVLAAKAQIGGVKTVTTRSWAGVKWAPAGRTSSPAAVPSA